MKFLLILATGFVLISCASSPERKAKRGIADAKYASIYDAFSTHDTNGDGYIDQHEFFQFQQDPQIVQLRQRIPDLSHSIPLLFEEVDENGDDKISLDE
ncbi:EF-hand domain-containing protein, partial [Kaarinaea lacus]